MTELGSSTEHKELVVTLGTYGHDNYATVNISHGRLKSAVTLTFMRTLRVPDNQDVNELPPSLGQFPLFSVEEYKHRMPEDIAKKGGIFLPMYQREAMWINFHSKEPFALKIYVGGINAISGIPINETLEAKLKRLRLSKKVKQDYVVLPDQPWLDGIATQDGRIRQFVAMPKGSGYSVEAQVTGEEKIDGIQFEVTPVKRCCPESLGAFLFEGPRYNDSPSKEKTLKLREKGLSDMSMVWDLKKVVEAEFGLVVENQELRLKFLSHQENSRDLDDDGLMLDEIWIPESCSLEIRDKLAPSERTSRYPSNNRALGFIRGGSASRGGAMSRGSTTRQYSSTWSKSKSSQAEVKAMSLAAGGLIRQTIMADGYPAAVWDTESSILFNVQLLNSDSFQAVTGRVPPPSPVDVKTYQRHGYPFFEIWNEGLSGIKGDFDAVKSVREIDEDLAKKITEGGHSGQDQKDSGFKRDESLVFPIITLDMGHAPTFKPLKQMEEELRSIKANA